STESGSSVTRIWSRWVQAAAIARWTLPAPRRPQRPRARSPATRATLARAVGRGILVVAVLAAACVAAPAALAGPGLSVGAVEDAAKWSSDPAATLQLAKAAGFDTVRFSAQWPSDGAASAILPNLRRAADAAAASGIRPIVSIYNTGSSATPADDASRVQFVVGNEPNSNQYWLPQFDAAGGDAAAVAYEQLLAAAYDAIKGARPDATLVGGALDPRGNDNPGGAKLTHSPTTFIRDLGAAYRASGRTKPIMDVWDQHVYADTSALPPSMLHSSSTTVAEGDYAKLVALLGQAFDGTAQPGSTLPILYGEFGVESAVPAAKASAYSGTEPSSTQPVDESTQAAYYAEAFKLALCQPNVIGILVFHVSDESSLSGWQSGAYYADDTPKSSRNAIKAAADAARSGTLAQCPDTRAPSVTLAQPSAAVVGPAGVTLTGTASDDIGVGRVELLANGAVVGTKVLAPYTFTWKPAQSGPTTLELRATDAAGNVGVATATVTADVTPPETTITQGDGARFSFAASEPATFECSLDGAPFSPCTSPVSYALANGDHSLSVRAKDALGNV